MRCAEYTHRRGCEAALRGSVRCVLRPIRARRSLAVATPTAYIKPVNNTDPPIVKDLVLIGGGHSHIAVLRSFGMKPVPGVRLTLICPDVYTPYSGMLPGFIAGHYQFDDIHIDLAVLARFAGARLFLDAVTGIDPVERRVLCANRTAVPYDLVSVNAGSTPNTADVPGAADFVIPVKPINRFAAGWEDLSARLVARDGALRLGVVGGGAGGVELALAVSHRLHELRGETAASGSLEVHLVTQEDDILTTHNHRAAALLNRQLVEHGGQRTSQVPGLGSSFRRAPQWNRRGTQPR